jgi:hypothetical protein
VKLVGVCLFSSLFFHKAFFLSLNIADRANPAAKVALSIPITLGELEVIKSTMSFCIPRFLGFHALF